MAEILPIRRKTQSMKTKEASSILTAEEVCSLGWGLFFGHLACVSKRLFISYSIPFFSTFEKFFNTLTEKKL